MNRTAVTGIVAGLALLVVVVLAVRRGGLREDLAGFWIITALGVFALGVSERLRDSLRDAIGAENSMSAIFFVAIVFLTLLLLRGAVQISRLDSRVRRLTQELAIAQLRIEEISTDSPRIPEWGRTETSTLVRNGEVSSPQ